MHIAQFLNLCSTYSNTSGTEILLSTFLPAFCFPYSKISHYALLSSILGNSATQSYAFHTLIPKSSEAHSQGYYNNYITSYTHFWVSLLKTNRVPNRSAHSVIIYFDSYFEWLQSITRSERPEVEAAFAFQLLSLWFFFCPTSVS